jgi:hypothetical protein
VARGRDQGGGGDDPLGMKAAGSVGRGETTERNGREFGIRRGERLRMDGG